MNLNPDSKCSGKRDCGYCFVSSCKATCLKRPREEPKPAQPLRDVGTSAVPGCAPSEEARLVARPSDISREAGNPDFYVKTDVLLLVKFYQ